MTCLFKNLASFYFRYLFIYFESQKSWFPVHPWRSACRLTQLAEAVGRPDNGIRGGGTRAERVSLTDTDGVLLYNTGLRSFNSGFLLPRRAPFFYFTLLGFLSCRRGLRRSGCCIGRWRTCTCRDRLFPRPDRLRLEDGRRRKIVLRGGERRRKHHNPHLREKRQH